MSWLSSFFTPMHCDAGSEVAHPHENAPEHKEDKPEEESQEVATTDEKEEAEEEPAAEEEEEEEEEPEDVLPALREECQSSNQCAPAFKHFQHCEEKVSAGHGFKGEDCVEELLMHCVDNCVAPKLWSKLK